MNIIATFITATLCQFAVFTYFDKAKRRPISATKTFLLALASSVLTGAAELSDTRFLSPTVFIAVCFCVLLFGYSLGIRNALPQTLIIGIPYICAHAVTHSIFSLLLTKGSIGAAAGLPLSVLENASAKTLFFVTLMSLTAFVYGKDSKFSVFSVIMPLFSIATVAETALFVYFSFTYALPDTIETILTAVSLILLFMSGAVFYAHEKTVASMEKENEYRIELRQKENRLEHYSDLEMRTEQTERLLHDIKNHIENIKLLVLDGDCDGAVKYCDSVFESNSFLMRREFSNNKLINVILGKYCDLCEKNGIDYSADVRAENFDFISDSDLSCILDNLLKNAYEAAIASEEKRISFTADSKGTSFLRFITVNSCDKAPKTDGDNFVTTKSDAENHGYGMKTIKRIAKKYSGDAVFTYRREKKEFTAAVICCRE